MRITFDTDRDTYAQAAHRLRSAYRAAGRLPSGGDQPKPSYAGKFVLEPLPPICREPGTEA
ncbi:hypothetical protein OG883_45700 [Streptomyces sp. NBC_01142]|uniref:hypothetical protein n=1 Tax=Streptomyces sp. NBC_01142 TaxID=2975865 RepID=UPI00225B7D0D|nr:hypothetical protein [Streptomyces sp. NBC_01142]MCX4826935.1 hypothetical protein [Streptomyces sp. NBC_01142]